MAVSREENWYVAQNSKIDLTLDIALVEHVQYLNVFNIKGILTLGICMGVRIA